MLAKAVLLVSKIVVPISHLDTKTWVNRVQVEKYHRYPLTVSMDNSQGANNEGSTPQTRGQVFLLATMELSTMDTGLNTTFKHVSEGLHGYIQHKHREPCFLIMGPLK